MTSMRWLRSRVRLARASEGVSTIEFALFAAPLISVLICGMLDFGTAMWRQMQVGNAARAGAAYAAINGWNATSTQIENAITSATNLSGVSASPIPSWTCGCASSSGIASAACGATCSDGSTAGHYVTVGAQASYSLLLPWPGITSPMTLTATSIARLYP